MAMRKNYPNTLEGIRSNTNKKGLIVQYLAFQENSAKCLVSYGLTECLLNNFIAFQPPVFEIKERSATASYIYNRKRQGC